MPQVVLDLSEGVVAFGASFLHFSAGGIVATSSARLRVYDGSSGTGELLGQVQSAGGSGLIDFVGVGSKGSLIRSVIIDTEGGTTYCVSGYGIVQTD